MTTELKPACYRSDQEPSHGFCVVCNRKRPVCDYEISVASVDNFGCFEAEADEEDNEAFGPGELFLYCGGCGAMCVPIFDPAATPARSEP